MKISQEQFDYICGLAKKTSAQVIGGNKAYLIENRLAPVARKFGYGSAANLIDHLKTQPGHTEIHDNVIEALTTNETYFFRDFHPFEALEKTIVPALSKRPGNSRQINIWSAACSTGQEAYSFAMLLREKFSSLSDWKFKIVGTDINNQVLAQARAGIYSQIEVNRGLPALYLAKYFKKTDADWQIAPEIQKMVEFKKLNLVSEWQGLPKFDIVLLRNVLIYFDTETKRSILKATRNVMHDHAALFLGAAETTVNIDPNWDIETSGRSVYYTKIPETN